jgi:hypothetical protein
MYYCCFKKFLGRHRMAKENCPPARGLRETEKIDDPGHKDTFPLRSDNHSPPLIQRRSFHSPSHPRKIQADLLIIFIS